MRILMTSTRGAGHFGPLRAFAGAFAREGHDVLVAIPEEAVGMVQRAGLRAWPLPEPDAGVRDAVFARTRGVSNDEANAIVVGDLFAAVYARASLPGVEWAVHEFRPDVIVHESSEYAGPLVAERAELPAVHVCVGLISLGDATLDWAARHVDAIRREQGLAPDPRGERLYDRPTLSLMPPALDGRPSPALYYREPRPDPAPAAWSDDGRPLLYLSLGSVVPSSDAYPGLYRAAIDRLVELPIRLLVSTGGQEPEALGRLPDGVRAERWVDEPALGHHLAAMVSHGGAGSIRTALAAGVPLAVMPLFGDQPHNARAVAGAGAGVAVDDGPSGLADAVGAVLEDPSYRRRAEEIALEVAALPPVHDAVAVLREQVARATTA
jgi:UDP:flavonoid glycosyltransferase YjiC (YdhE family)